MDLFDYKKEKELLKFYFRMFFIISFILLMFVSICHARVITKKAIIHHTASPSWTTVEHIDQWHKENGWDGIGYHFVILWDGNIKEGRSLNKQGSHALGRNQYVGIALVGYDEFTKEQIISLNILLERLGVEEIERHHEKCPGKGLNLNNFLKERK
jgi:hypothetical protein